MNFKNLSLLFGVVFLLVGVLGFVPGITNDQHMLLGIFQVSALHNVIHLLSGIAALLASRAEAYAKLYFKIFGLVYLLVAVVGWVQGDTVLGLIDVNLADNLLHTVLGVAIAGIGFGLPAGKSTTPRAAV